MSTNRNLKNTIYTVVIVLVFLVGFRSAIILRYKTQKELIPNKVVDKYLSKFEVEKYKHPYLELCKRCLVCSREEYSRYKMEILFNLVTKSWMEWFVNFEPENSKILDIGGATGMQWRVINKALDKNFDISLLEIDRNSIEIGKENYQDSKLKFYHISETKKINKKINTILLCGVYMQIDNSAKVLKNYLDMFPNSKAVVIHTTFKYNFWNKFFNFVKKDIFKYLPLLDLFQGRAMADKNLYNELDKVNLKVIQEYNLSYLSKTKIPFDGKIKAYIIVKSKEKFIERNLHI